MTDADEIALFGLIPAIVGALAWVPILIDKCKGRKIYTKVLTLFCNTGQTYTGYGLNITGPVYFMKIVFHSSNKDLLIRKVKGKIKYLYQL